jgi:carboxylesterase
MTHRQDIFHEGSRIGVLLIHGLAGTPKEMDSIGRRLRRYGFTVSIPVLPGHCGDTAELLASDRHDWGAAVEDACLDLAGRSDAVFAGGLSAGALLGILTARKYPALRGLALYSTTLTWDGWSVPKAGALLPFLLRIPLFRKTYRFAEAFPYGIKNEKLRERIMMKLESGDTSAAGHTDTPGEILFEMLRIGDEAKKRMPEVETPALIVHAEQDDLASVRNALYVHKHLGGESELLLLKNSYHLVTVDQERREVARSTARFFRERLTKEERRELASAAEKGLR